MKKILCYFIFILFFSVLICMNSSYAYSNTYTTNYWYTETFNDEVSGTQPVEDWLSSTETTQYFRILSDDFKIRRNTANPQGKWTFDYPKSYAIGYISFDKNANDADDATLYWNFTDADNDHLFRITTYENGQLGDQIGWLIKFWNYDTNVFDTIFDEDITDGNTYTYSQVNFTFYYTNHSVKLTVEDYYDSEYFTEWVTDSKYFTDDFITDDSSIRHIEFYMVDADADDYDVIDDFSIKFIESISTEFTDVSEYIDVYGDFFIEFAGFGEECYYYELNPYRDIRIYYNLTDAYFYETNSYKYNIVDSTGRVQTSGYVYNETGGVMSGYQDITWFSFPVEGRYKIILYNVTSSGVINEIVYEGHNIDVCDLDDSAEEDEEEGVDTVGLNIIIGLVLTLGIGIAFAILAESPLLFFAGAIPTAYILSIDALGAYQLLSSEVAYGLIVVLVLVGVFSWLLK